MAYEDDTPDNKYDSPGLTFPNVISGNYRMNDKGEFEPYGDTAKSGTGGKVPLNNPLLSAKRTYDALTKNYLRRQAGNPYGMTTVAPNDVLRGAKPLDPYGQFGVSLPGLQSNTYGALFSPIPGSYA